LHATSRFLASLVAAALLAALPVLASCRHPEDEPYRPGLGEIMTLQQMRHTKLWLAGQAHNWELAQYEIDELGEGFDDAVRFHPTHKDAPVGPRDLVHPMTDAPLAALRAAVARRDTAAFTMAYDRLTVGCNNCHTAMRFGFNVVVRPQGNPFANQSFASPTGPTNAQPAPTPR
jgi:hypothetical protein